MNLPQPNTLIKAAVMTAASLAIITIVKNMLPATAKATVNKVLFGA